MWEQKRPPSRCRWLSAFIGGLLIAFAVAPLGAQETLIQIRAFLAKESVTEPGRKASELINPRSDARLAPIAAMVNGTESDLRAAAIRALSGLRDFESVEYLFSLVVYWDGRSETTGDFVIQPPASYRFELRPSWDPSGLLDFRLAAYAKEIPDWPPKGSKQEAAAERTLFAAIHPDFFKERMEKVLESDVLLAVEEPGLLIVPFRYGTLVLFLMPAARPQPVFQALPVYPGDLNPQGIAGRGRYRDSIDKKGKVRNVAVKTSVHPFLDDAAVQAIRTWTFEPVTKGLEAVAVSFDWTIDFDPARWPGLDRRAAPGAPGSYSAELERLLALAAGYCERLSAAALDFVCRESQAAHVQGIGQAQGERSLAREDRRRLAAEAACIRKLLPDPSPDLSAAAVRGWKAWEGESCPRCGDFSPVSSVVPIPCAACAADPPAFDAARSLFLHAGHVRAAVLTAKYAGRPFPAGAVADRLRDAFRGPGGTCSRTARRRRWFRSPYAP